MQSVQLDGTAGHTLAQHFSANASCFKLWTVADVVSGEIPGGQSCETGKYLDLMVSFRLYFSSYISPAVLDPFVRFSCSW